MLLETLPIGYTPLDMTDLSGKVAVITGAASGIGLSLARRLHAEGMKLVLADIDHEALERSAGDLGALCLQVDVRDAGAMQSLAQQAVEAHGTVHLYCSNAGVSRMASNAGLTQGDWRWLFDINLFGAVNGVEAFLPVLKANPNGAHILFTASLSSFYPTRAQAAYGASKYALAAYGETLALELHAEGAKVGVTLLCPGPVRTNIRWGYLRQEARYKADARGEDTPPDMHEQAFRGATRDEDWMEPDAVVDAALAGMRRGEIWVITQPQLMTAALDRNHAIAEATQRAQSAATD